MNDEELQSARRVFLDVDTQIDFMLSHGALYVPGAETIIPRLRALMNYAQEHEILVLSSADAHPPDDPSFSEWPPHCIIGTPGQQRIPETQLPSPLVIPPYPVAAPFSTKDRGQIIVEKTDYDISSNPNFDAILNSIMPGRFVAFGVATEYCVCASVLVLRRRGFAVDLVTDAIQSIREEDARKAIEEMARAGVRLIETAAAVSGTVETAP